MRLPLVLLFIAFGGLSTRAQDAFIAKPYLQLGAEPKPGRLDVVWLAGDQDQPWSLELKSGEKGPWLAMPKPSFRTVALPGVPAHRVYTATLNGLKPGAVFHYRVATGGKAVFEAAGHGPKRPEQAQHLVLYGDGASGSPDQKAIAIQMARQNPDAVIVLGDIVYSRGRASEYLDHYFSIYNADSADPSRGAPLLRSVPSVAALGNHDVMPLNAQGDRPSDGLAYYCYWDLPLNGPALKVAGPHTPYIQPMFWSSFLTAAGPRFPSMGNYSFDLGNAHFTILDSNPYVDWEAPALKAWLESDLRRASKADWRIVAFHHPGFNSSVAHFEDAWMRLLSPIFEKHRVQMVFSGHVHSYQRSLPLSFKPEAGAAAKIAVSRHGEVKGVFNIDRSFDGVKATKAKGIIYVISGAGGAELYNTRQDGKPETWQPFTKVMVSDRYSFTVLDLKGKRAELRQIAEDGRELDHFVLTQ